MASREQVLLLYRQILRAAKSFPSIKRNSVVVDIKAEFRDHRAVTDVEAVRKHMAVGIRSLETLQSYSNMDSQSKSDDWSVYLKGSCD